MLDKKLYEGAPKKVNEWFGHAEELAASREVDDGRGWDPMWFHIGCANFPDRETLMLIVESARELCGMDKVKTRRLLLEALARL